LKYVWYKIVRFYVKLGLVSYFKKIKVYGRENIPKNQPILFVSNHRNGLIDPILIAISSGRVHNFLTRASAFKNPIANFLLRSIKMLPIYRIRDGVDSIQKNQAIFDTCFSAFNKKETVLIFPEGNHGLYRRLRPLSKGFTRIAFGYIDKYAKKDLLIVPIGLNYSDMQEKGSAVSIYYGEPILTYAYYTPNDENEGIERLKSEVSTALKKLSTHIDDVENHKNIEQVLIQKGIDFLDPFTTNKTIETTTDWTVQKDFPKPKKSPIASLLKLLFSINTLFPILAWYSLKEKSNDFVLIPTFRYGLSIGLIPLFYILQALLVSYFSSFLIGFIYFLCSILLLHLYKNSIQTDNVTTEPS